VLKTREQRLAEKALMDKSPLKTLTLEDFLESERHKLTGTLTPVTPETFANWKKERLDKKAAEAEAQKAKDATGKAMFESGNWKGSEDEDSDEEDDDDGRWNLEAMRRETERLREQREQERLAKMNGEPMPTVTGIDSSIDSVDGDGGGGSSGSGGSESNGEEASGER
jgi:DRG Family Regulatory Proteins, Tma46